MAVTGFAAPAGRQHRFQLGPAIARLLAPRGISTDELLREVGLPLDCLYREAVAPLPTIRAFVSRAAERSGSQHFGLELAAMLEGGIFGVTDFLVRTATTIERGLEALCRYGALIDPMWKFRYRTTELHFDTGAGEHLDELAIAYVVGQLGGALGRPLALTEVWFAHARPLGASEVVQHFGCTVRFQAADSGFATTRDELARPPRLADPALFRFLEAQACAQLADLEPED
jgi:hypothetical protein